MPLKDQHLRALDGGVSTLGSYPPNIDTQKEELSLMGTQRKAAAATVGTTRQVLTPAGRRSHNAGRCRRCALYLYQYFQSCSIVHLAAATPLPLGARPARLRVPRTRRVHILAPAKGRTEGVSSANARTELRGG